MKESHTYETIAAVDLGSNSFRLQVSRVVDDQVYPLDGVKEMVRLAMGLNEHKQLDLASQQRAIDCLKRFNERIRDFPQEAVRVVATNTLRVAKNTEQFLKDAQLALGFPIEIISGREEARLIYIGVAHEFPGSDKPRLVVDIGGGSTEFIIGKGIQPEFLESLNMGCVSYTQRYFTAGKINEINLSQAEWAARIRLQYIINQFKSDFWVDCMGSSGTAKSLGEIFLANGWTDGTITLEALEKLRTLILTIGDVTKLNQIQGLKQERALVLPGGLAIMYAIFTELNIDRPMKVAKLALRDGVLYDLIGRFHHQDIRDVTVRQLMKRYHLDAIQAKRVAHLANRFFESLEKSFSQDYSEHDRKVVEWACLLHETGISVAHSAYHKHGAYIIGHADMPGFSQFEQDQLARLINGHRGSLDKIQREFKYLPPVEWSKLLILRLSVLMQRNRRDIDLPDFELIWTSTTGFTLKIKRDWLKNNPLTETALQEESDKWASLGLAMPLNIMTY